MPISEVFNIDCMEYMKNIPDKFFDLAIVDPPYGIKENDKKVISRAKAKKSSIPKYVNRGSWQDSERPSKEYFEELFRVSKNQIIWGGNYFIDYLYPTSGIICWYKKKIGEKNDFSDFELAWTSFKKGARLFHYPWIGFASIHAGERKIHRTQKPVALYRWILNEFAKPNWKIFDSHLGSGSSRIACYEENFDFWGCEIDPIYFKDMQARFEEYTKQPKLF